MKRLMIALALLSAASCSRTLVGGKGQVSFEVISEQYVSEQTKGSVSEYTELPSGSDFTIIVTDASKSSVWEGMLDEWDTEALWPEGAYSVKAFYGDIEDEGFDKPYFVGETEFKVVNEQTSAVSVPVSLGNTLVKVGCSELFKDYYTEYAFEVSRDGMKIVTFGRDEERAAFVDGYKLTLSGTLAREGRQQSFTKDYSGLEPATVYTFYFDIDNVGSATIKVSFNDEVETIDLGNVELN